FGNDYRRNQKERRRRKIARHEKLAGLQMCRSIQSDRAVIYGDIGSELAQSDFGVIAGADFLDDCSGTLRIEATKKNATLNLSAGYRQLIVDRIQRAAMNGQRREPSIASFDAGTHSRKRSHDAIHRAA